MKILKQVINISPQSSKVINKYTENDYINDSLYKNNETIIQNRIVRHRKVYFDKDDNRSHRMIIGDYRKNKQTIRNIDYERWHLNIDEKRTKMGLLNKQKIALLYDYDKEKCINYRNEL